MPAPCCWAPGQTPSGRGQLLTRGHPASPFVSPIKYTVTELKLRLAMAAMGQPETQVGRLCEELGVTRQTLYRHVSPKGDLRSDGKKLLSGGRAD